MMYHTPPFIRQSTSQERRRRRQMLAVLGQPRPRSTDKSHDYDYDNYCSSSSSLFVPATDSFTSESSLLASPLVRARSAAAAIAASTAITATSDKHTLGVTPTSLLPTPSPSPYPSPSPSPSPPNNENGTNTTAAVSGAGGAANRKRNTTTTTGPRFTATATGTTASMLGISPSLDPVLRRLQGLSLGFSQTPQTQTQTQTQSFNAPANANPSMTGNANANACSAYNNTHGRAQGHAQGHGKGNVLSQRRGSSPLAFAPITPDSVCDSLPPALDRDDVYENVNGNENGDGDDGAEDEDDEVLKVVGVVVEENGFLVRERERVREDEGEYHQYEYQVLLDLFERTGSRVLCLKNLPSTHNEAVRVVACLFSGGSTSSSSSATNSTNTTNASTYSRRFGTKAGSTEPSVPVPMRMWTLRAAAADQFGLGGNFLSGGGTNSKARKWSGLNGGRGGVVGNVGVGIELGGRGGGERGLVVNDDDDDDDLNDEDRRCLAMDGLLEEEECLGVGSSSGDSEGLVVWAVFGSHEEASTALMMLTTNSPLPLVSVNPALETDLEPFSKLKRFELEFDFSFSSKMNSRSSIVLMNQNMNYSLSPAAYDYSEELAQSREEQRLLLIQRYQEQIQVLQQQVKLAQPSCEFTLSTNPPTPKFRQGDWICAVPSCAMHNFGKNTNCFQCAVPRNGGRNCPQISAGLLSGQMNGIAGHPYPQARSPRFALGMNGMNNGVQVHSSPASLSSSGVFAAQQQQSMSNMVTSSGATKNGGGCAGAGAMGKVQSQQSPQQYPILTPSGRSFAVGGKVQNVSPDPLAPCVMFWPDNEPLPEIGQIRPASLVNVHQPPIMNTGNKGPIEHQPGDWVCQKCDYLNWRRRKVCQTCFPYAEGNGDSVSQAMQAERLTLLAQHQLQIQQTQAHDTKCIPPTSMMESARYPYSATHDPTTIAAVANNAVPYAPPYVKKSAAVDFGSGNIVYQTPTAVHTPEPATFRPALSLTSALAAAAEEPRVPTLETGVSPLIPSFLKQEFQSSMRSSAHGGFAQSRNGARSPVSLSPASSSSASLSHEDDVIASPMGTMSRFGAIGSRPTSGNGSVGSAGLYHSSSTGMGAKSIGAFYAHHTASGSGSSTGSSSSLTLGGNSIWSLDHNEDELWSRA